MSEDDGPFCSQAHVLRKSRSWFSRTPHPPDTAAMASARIIPTVGTRRRPTVYLELRQPITSVSSVLQLTPPTSTTATSSRPGQPPRKPQANPARANQRGCPQGQAVKIGYGRVSTDGQTLDLQLDALHAASCKLVFQDLISGANDERPGLDQAPSCSALGTP